VAGRVIGRGGENIQAVQARTGTRVSVQAMDSLAPGAAERLVTVVGSPAGVADAKKLLLAIVEDRMRAAAEGGGGAGGGGGGGAPLMFVGAGGGPGGALLAPAGSVAGGAASVTVQIPDDRAGAVIGRAGGNIKQIQARTGTHVNVPREGDAANRAVRTVIITGPTTAHCEAAKAEVLAALHIGGGGGGAGGEPGAPAPLPAPPPGQTQFAMQVLDDRAGAIIGKGGATIRDLQDRTGCRIQVPNQADPTTGMRNVIITGLPANVEMAKGEVMAIATGAVRPGGPGAGGPPGGFGGGGGGYGGGAPPGAYGYNPYGGGFPMGGGGYPAAAPGYGGGYPHGPPGAAPAANPYAAYAAYYGAAQQQAAAAAAAAAAAQQRPGGGGGGAAPAGAAGPAPGATPEMQAAWAAYYAQMKQLGGGQKQ
jgi:far upstream element-binding protein